MPCVSIYFSIYYDVSLKSHTFIPGELPLCSDCCTYSQLLVMSPLAEQLERCAGNPVVSGSIPEMYNTTVSWRKKFLPIFVQINLPPFLKCRRYNAASPCRRKVLERAKPKPKCTISLNFQRHVISSSSVEEES